MDKILCTFPNIIDIHGKLIPLVSKSEREAISDMRNYVTPAFHFRKNQVFLRQNNL